MCGAMREDIDMKTPLVSIGMDHNWTRMTTGSISSKAWNFGFRSRVEMGLSFRGEKPGHEISIGAHFPALRLAQLPLCSDTST
jgi:hypothetical protein